MPRWTLSYQPLVGEQVVFDSVDTSTEGGLAELHSEINEALHADATQINLLLSLMGDEG